MPRLRTKRPRRRSPCRSCIDGSGDAGLGLRTFSFLCTYCLSRATESKKVFPCFAFNCPGGRSAPPFKFMICCKVFVISNFKLCPALQQLFCSADDRIPMCLDVVLRLFLIIQKTCKFSTTETTIWCNYETKFSSPRVNDFSRERNDSENKEINLKIFTQIFRVCRYRSLNLMKQSSSKYLFTFL